MLHLWNFSSKFEVQNCLSQMRMRRSRLLCRLHSHKLESWLFWLKITSNQMVCRHFLIENADPIDQVSFAWLILFKSSNLWARQLKFKIFRTEPIGLKLLENQNMVGQLISNSSLLLNWSKELPPDDLLQWSQLESLNWTVTRISDERSGSKLLEIE